jgi:hypothetical protein
MNINYHTAFITPGWGSNKIGRFSILDSEINTPGKYLNIDTDVEDFDTTILIQMIYDLCQTVDDSILLRLDKKYIKIDKIKIDSLNIMKTISGEITDLFYLVFDIPCVVDGKKTKYRKECIFKYDLYKSYLRDKKLNDIL